MVKVLLRIGIMITVKFWDKIDASEYQTFFNKLRIINIFKLKKKQLTSILFYLKTWAYISLWRVVFWNHSALSDKVYTQKKRPIGGI